MKGTIPLDSRTVLLGSSIQDILKRTAKHRRGIDFRLYTTNPNDKDKQTVMTFLSSLSNPSESYRVDKQTVENLISEQLDKILLSDRVRSCNDFYRTNNKKDMDSSNSMRIL